MKRTSTSVPKSSLRSTSKAALSRAKAASAAPPQSASRQRAKSSEKAATKSPSSRRKPAVPVLIASVPESRTKQAQLIELLGSNRGASMAQMVDLTGWQPHTVRGMLSGSLRKRLGLNVRYGVEEGVRVYRIHPEVTAA